MNFLKTDKLFNFFIIFRTKINQRIYSQIKRYDQLKLFLYTIALNRIMAEKLGELHITFFGTKYFTQVSTSVGNTLPILLTINISHE